MRGFDSLTVARSRLARGASLLEAAGGLMPAATLDIKLWDNMRGGFPLPDVEMREFVEDAARRCRAPVRAIMSPAKDRQVAWARQEAMAAIYATGRYSTLRIGRFFKRDHSTVVHAIHAVARRQKERLGECLPHAGSAAVMEESAA